MDSIAKKINQTCRICSEDQENAILIFGDEGKELYLQAKIRKYLYITVSIDDKFPKRICEDCCMKLDGIHRFATMAVKTQDKFNKLFSSNGSSSNDNTETKSTENRGLLHTYLTKGTVEKTTTNSTSPSDNEVTEMEVRVDPMMILQCTGDDDLSSNVSSPEDEDEDNDDEDDNDTNHSSISAKSENSTEDFVKSRKPYNCSICPRRFTCQFALQNHMWSHLNYGRKVLSTNDNNSIKKEPEPDQECAASENNESSTENSSNCRFSCPVCGKQISTKGNLKVHLETHRPKGKYGCDICGRIFKTQSNLYRHKEYHGGVQYPCTVCGRVYPTNSTLRAHSITHSDLRPHKCPLCDKTFKRNQDLKFHINQHTGARPYQCPYCPKAFASSGNCFSHRKRMHPQEVERDREKAAEIMR